MMPSCCSAGFTARTKSFLRLNPHLKKFWRSIGNRPELISAFLGDRSRFGVVVVTTAEEMPVEESLELISALDERLDREPEVVIANALYPAVDEDDGEDDPTTALWRDRRAINVTQLERLDASWAGPLAEIPLLPVDPGPALIGAIARRIETQLRSS